MKKLQSLGLYVFFAIILQTIAFESICFGQYVSPSGNRVTVNFNPDWKYYQGDVTGADATTFSDASWSGVALPHSTKWNTPDADAEYSGVSWYRKHFTLGTAGYQGKKVFIEFEGAMQQSQVWVNGVSKGTYEGGYMGFVYDITNNVSFTGDNVIAVRINSAANAAWAPGKQGVDFRYYGGIYRDAWLHITDNLHVTHALFANVVAGGGVFVTYPAVSTSSATVSIKTHVQNEGTASANCTIVSDIVDKNGTLAGTATATATIAAGASNTFTQTITITNPKLWNHLAPNLYVLHTTIKNGTTTVDHVTTKIGIRRIAWTRSNGIQINGVSYKLQGTNEHQDIFGLGNALPNKAIFYEVKMIKEAGFDFIRCCHYPHDPAFYDACDSLGILVMDCLTGWQNFPNTTGFNNNTYKECREMVRRDRNHPCVVVWETSLNESGYTTAWAQAVHNYAHAEYPGDQLYTNGYSTTIFDVFSDAAAHAALYNESTRPVIVAEYGDWEYGGLTSTSRVHRESADAALIQQAYNHQERMAILHAYSWYGVDNLWSYADNGSNYLGGPFYGGAVDMYRLPKFTYYFLRSQRNSTESIQGVSMGPMVYIANTWRTGSPTTVKVFSNCTQVSLYLNGTLVQTRSPDNNAVSVGIKHPPFTFTLTGFTSGTLRAAGLVGGVEVTSFTRTTPGTATAVRLRPISTDPLDADGSDARLVWIDVVDGNGMVVPASTANVNLSITGIGTILGPTTVAMKGGQLATWVRAGTASGTLTLTAASTGLTSGTLTLSNAVTTALLPSAISGATVMHTARNCVFKANGANVRLPAEFAGVMKAVMVYDLCGKLVYRTVLDKNVFSIPKINNVSRQVFMVEVHMLR